MPQRKLIRTETQETPTPLIVRTFHHLANNRNYASLPTNRETRDVFDLVEGFQLTKLMDFFFADSDKSIELADIEKIKLFEVRRVGLMRL